MDVSAQGRIKVILGPVQRMCKAPTPPHLCCTLAIEKYQIYKVISRHRVAQYDLVGLIFFVDFSGVFVEFIADFSVDSFVDVFVDFL